VLFGGHLLTQPVSGGMGASDRGELGWPGRHKLTESHLTRQTPIWSPDGTLIAYVVSDNATHSNLFVSNLDGTRKKNLTRKDFKFSGTPSWPPDGSLIAFSSDHSGNPNYEIHVVRPDETSFRRITHLKGADIDPDWSPHGHTIAFVWDNDPHFDKVLSRAPANRL
jgi:Tol biopolymer transport system component